MPQHDMVLDNTPGAVFRADANNALLALATLNSGPSAPATPYANMLWADTTALQLKKRNSANTTWVVIGDLDAQNFGLLSQVALRNQSVIAFTSAGTQPTFTVTTGYGALAAGQRLRVAFNAAVTFGAQPTLNRDGLGARNVVQYDASGVKQRGRILSAGQLCDLEYDGTDFVILNPIRGAVIDLTGYTGADIPIGVGESVTYSPSAVTSQALRLAVGNNQIYTRYAQDTAAVSGSSTDFDLQMNNTDYVSAFTHIETYTNVVTNVTGNSVLSLSRFGLNIRNIGFINPYCVDIFTGSSGQRKSVTSRFLTGSNATASFSGGFTSVNSAAVAWSSMGTEFYGRSYTGLITYTRIR